VNRVSARLELSLASAATTIQSAKGLEGFGFSFCGGQKVRMARKQQDWWTRTVVRAAKNGIGGEKFEAL
jgi:hypothetical protein